MKFDGFNPFQGFCGDHDDEGGNKNRRGGFGIDFAQVVGVGDGGFELDAE